MHKRLRRLISTLIATAVFIPIPIEANRDHVIRPAGAAPGFVRIVASSAGASAVKDAVGQLPGEAAAGSFAPDTLRLDLYGSGDYPAISDATDADAGTGPLDVLAAGTIGYQCLYRLMPKALQEWQGPSAPGNGYLYGFDAYTNTLLYRVPITRTDPLEATVEFAATFHSCRRTGRGAGWNLA